MKQSNKIDERGGFGTSKVNDDHRSYMVEVIETNYRIILQGIDEAIFRKYEIRISKETVSRHLDNLPSL